MSEDAKKYPSDEEALRSRKQEELLANIQRRVRDRALERIRSRLHGLEREDQAGPSSEEASVVEKAPEPTLQAPLIPSEPAPRQGPAQDSPAPAADPSWKIIARLRQELESALARAEKAEAELECRLTPPETAAKEPGDAKTWLKGKVVAVDRVHGIAFIKSEDGRLYGMSDYYLAKSDWNRVQVGACVKFEDNGYGATEKVVFL